ncbi:MAG: glycosyltransferase [Thermoplasmata archaeon]
MTESRSDISVIITAYNRKNFVADAIRSVFNQSYDTSKIELIIISNFDVDLPAPVPAGIKVKTIRSEGTIGEFLYQGISHAEAEIVAFLDDDDLWEPSKVYKLLSAFNDNKELILYRNSLNYIDESGTPIRYRRTLDMLPCKLEGLRIFEKEELIRNLPVILSCGGDFNLSTFAIRKNIMNDSRYEQLRSIVSGPDALFFWTSVLESGTVAIDSDPLTLYRVHNLNVSGSVDTSFKSMEITREAKTFKILIEHLDENTDVRVLRWMNLLYHEYSEMSLIFSAKGRKIVGREFVQTLRYPIRMMHTMRIELLLLSVAYIASPALALHIYKKLTEI